MRWNYNQVYLKEFLIHWLLCCYDPDKSRYIALLDLSWSKCSIADLSLRIEILCYLGADIDQWFFTTEDTQLDRCVRSFNINVLRTLIINNCSLNEDTLKRTVRDLFELVIPNIYTFLRILLLSGADFDPVTLREIQRLIEYELEVKGLTNKDMKWIQAWFHEPHSLRFFCRKAIRNKFGKQLSRFLRDLEYPKMLKDYIRTIVL